jgi:hypothetical protein
MIYIHPHSGLANRIRAMVSGINLASQKNEELTIVWSKDQSLFCDFTDIFELNKKFKVKTIFYPKWYNRFISKRNWLNDIFSSAYNITNFLLDVDIPSCVWSNGSNMIDLNNTLNKVGNTYIYTCHEFLFDSSCLKFLQPTTLLKCKIREATISFGFHTIGVHIRRSDHIEAIDKSPIELFIKMMESYILINDGIQFFLSTDDIATENLLKQKFGLKILTNAKDFKRTTIEGIQGAVLDLYCLSLTKKIYGSYNSSFSDIAARIGDIPLKILIKD